MVERKESGEDAVLDFLAKEKESAGAFGGVPAGVWKTVRARS